MFVGFRDKLPLFCEGRATLSSRRRDPVPSRPFFPVPGPVPRKERSVSRSWVKSGGRGALGPLAGPARRRLTRSLAEC